MTGQLPIFQLKLTATDEIIAETNKSASSVVLMIETKESIKKIDEIASVLGVDLLLVGSNDVSIRLGVPSQFDSTEFRSTLESVSRAC